VGKFAGGVCVLEATAVVVDVVPEVAAPAIAEPPAASAAHAATPRSIFLKRLRIALSFRSPPPVFTSYGARGSWENTGKTP